jgi:hypothetical protein
VPSGIWDASEYEKLPGYDAPTPTQPIGAFFCHQNNGRLCAGWVGCHNMDESLGLRMARSVGILSSDDVEAARAYTSPVPLWDSGAEAAAHGMAAIFGPDEKARCIIAKLTRKRGRARGA